MILSRWRLVLHQPSRFKQIVFPWSMTSFMLMRRGNSKIMFQEFGFTKLQELLCELTTSNSCGQAEIKASKKPSKVNELLPLLPHSLSLALHFQQAIHPQMVSQQQRHGFFRSLSNHQHDPWVLHGAAILHDNTLE